MMPDGLLVSEEECLASLVLRIHDNDEERCFRTYGLNPDPKPLRTSISALVMATSLMDLSQDPVVASRAQERAADVRTCSSKATTAGPPSYKSLSPSRFHKWMTLPPGLPRAPPCSALKPAFSCIPAFSSGSDADGAEQDRRDDKWDAWSDRRLVGGISASPGTHLLLTVRSQDSIQPTSISSPINKPCSSVRRDPYMEVTADVPGESNRSGFGNDVDDTDDFDDNDDLEGAWVAWCSRSLSGRQDVSSPSACPGSDYKRRAAGEGLAAVTQPPSPDAVLLAANGSPIATPLPSVSSALVVEGPAEGFEYSRFLTCSDIDEMGEPAMLTSCVTSSISSPLGSPARGNGLAVAAACGALGSIDGKQHHPGLRWGVHVAPAVESVTMSLPLSLSVADHVVLSCRNPVEEDEEGEPVCPAWLVPHLEAMLHDVVSEALWGEEDACTELEGW
ncbi:hypothetical protein Agub_g11311 [Astrephomene gubernaculifera]|uniref:Uncharacterized protein n=1 Tax=Astrephomene gubernaculifera TaxID=47775 RepID=A0AAD3DWB0_9CHLO|nr:hypothetical protein Agub_g11311 [Astrephomene gubernaculifera]